MAVADIIRHFGIPEQKCYHWKRQYEGLQTDQVPTLKQLHDENARLNKLAAELSLDPALF